MKYKLLILIELSYKDESTLRHLINSFLSKFNLNYYDYVKKWNTGSVGIFIGRYSTRELKSKLVTILNSLDKYRPFIQFLALNYNGFWLSRKKINYLIDKNLTINNFIELPLISIFQLNQLSFFLQKNMIDIILLLLKNGEKRS